jgi:hypothetical protein
VSSTPPPGRNFDAACSHLENHVRCGQQGMRSRVRRVRQGVGDNRPRTGASSNASPYSDDSVGHHERCFRHRHAPPRAGPVAAKREKGGRKRSGLRRHAGPVGAARYQALGHLAGRTTAAKPADGTTAEIVAWWRAEPAGEVATGG